MRRVQKEQAERFVEKLEQAHRQLRKAVEEKDRKTAQMLLADCQNTAIDLGNLIEQAERGDLPIIKILEEYCESAYQIYKRLDSIGVAKANQIEMELRRFSEKIREVLRNDIKVRLEAVFLPYKVSMWDSLESVWKAAADDPDCDAYVVPIPYYDKNPDGSFGEMHYEGDLYPDDVPVIRYEDYDFAKHKPDMAFIHNPYDQYNHMTSVHPNFYTKELKRYAASLIYIPYFVMDDHDLDNKDVLERLKDFCAVPGVLNTDHVIVQSEAVRQAYVRTMVGYFGKHTQQRWENKILGLGSPKFDKVISMREEHVEIPEDWKNVICDSSGQKKKIILYNTSVNALFRFEEQMLKKMQKVFETFKEHRDEVALLWRPHPLTEAAIGSMRPELWESYQEIVQQYKKEGWGIYDDSAELDRALALSDAYYGDHSSLVQLCQSIGIPVMIQDVNLMEEDG